MTSQKATNITWHNGRISKNDRERLLSQKGIVIWFTGLPAAGKSTIAITLEEKLFEKGILSYVLDGDNIRHGLNKNLGFSADDREENIRRIGEVAKLFTQCGLVIMTAFISPYRADRAKARSLFSNGDFIEIYVKVPLEIAEQRDPKGLYRKARAGEIKEFTGIDAPYEEPENPELVLDTSILSPDECAEKIIAYLRDSKIVN